MTIKMTAATALLSIAAWTPAAAANYLPVGPQQNVDVSTVTSGGWSQCFVGAYGDTGPSVGAILEGCPGSKLMLAGRATGSSTLLLLAQADRADVLFDTGTGNVTHNANGSEWYYSDSWSWGFANGGDAVVRDSCDIPEFFGGGANLDLRLCWHTGGGQMNGGFRIGSTIFLNSEPSGYEKVIYAFTGAGGGGGGVPEPASWVMLIAGFGLVGAAARRSRTVAA